MKIPFRILLLGILATAAQLHAAHYDNNQDTNSVLPEQQWINLAPGSGHGSPLYYPVEFGPEVSFGRAMADAKPSENIAIIKYTYVGSTTTVAATASEQLNKLLLRVGVTPK